MRRGLFKVECQLCRLFAPPVHLGRRIGGLLPPSHANGQASSSSIPSQCRLRLPATISRPVSILKVAPRSVLESSRQLRGQRRPNVCTSPPSRPPKQQVGRNGPANPLKVVAGVPPQHITASFDERSRDFTPVSLFCSHTL